MDTHSVHVDRLEQLEREAREAGFSQRDARIIASNIVAVDRVSDVCKPNNVIPIDARRRGLMSAAAPTNHENGSDLS